MYKNVAFIPLRGGSKSIKLKNIKKINGRPLVYWTIDAALNTKEIDKVYVSTDHDQIKKVVNEYGSEKVIVIDRTEQSATDDAKTEVSMLDFAKNHDFENIVLIQATSPLLESIYIEEGLKLIEKKYDSVLSVTLQKRFVWEYNKEGAIPLNYNVLDRPMRQDFEGFYVENGAFYITKKQSLLHTNCRISGKIGLVIMPPENYFEVDESSDWLIIEQFLNKKCNQNTLN